MSRQSFVLNRHKYIEYHSALRGYIERSRSTGKIVGESYGPSWRYRLKGDPQCDRLGATATLLVLTSSTCKLIPGPSRESE